MSEAKGKYTTVGVSFPDETLLGSGRDRAARLGVSFSRYISHLIEQDLDVGGNMVLRERVPGASPATTEGSPFPPDLPASMPSTASRGPTQPIPIRIDAGTAEALDRVAAAMGNTRSGVMKLAIMSFLAHFEANGQKATLPLDWAEVLKSMHGRRKPPVQ